MDVLHSFRGDLFHAMRSLAKERVFSLFCVISLGIGMGAVVALVTFGRLVMAPAHGINATGLTELLVLPQGSLRVKSGTWALEQWSYPDYQALRHAQIGMAVTGWARESSEFDAPSADKAAAPQRVPTLYVSSNYFSTFGVSLARGSGYTAASAIAVSVALLAGLPAARRATSVQPMVAMRAE